MAVMTEVVRVRAIKKGAATRANKHPIGVSVGSPSTSRILNNTLPPLLVELRGGIAPLTHCALRLGRRNINAQRFCFLGISRALAVAIRKSGETPLCTEVPPQSVDHIKWPRHLNSCAAVLDAGWFDSFGSAQPTLVGLKREEH